ncbi:MULTISPECIES: fumarylacetoacetate hydrolase family protein [Paenibacillus]|uniref:fumarylacetoacetate hydrolase family protein n=1 Tax=Paenibacillus TaxID=44249 RepID=UPI0022B8FB68|nr:fumarylacetoacetate hydrolase family protein [Paenibacillus caseinilyticus]MCZ8522258.1 fumarylacetoacetate hydrolase family protein [Paenibacillus caseinilyticus]
MIYGRDVTRKVICIGPNFRSFRQEKGIVSDEELSLSLKSPESLTFSDTVHVSREMGTFVCEVEMAVIIGQDAKQISEAEAASVIAGYAIANDMTAVDHFGDGRFKMYDEMTPIGTLVQLTDPSDVHLELWVNEERIQQGHTSEMLFAPLWQVAHLSRIMTLRRGDVILSGTPANPSVCQAGDRVELRSPELGILRHTIALKP